MHSQDADELAKQLSNPIASLVSVPIQINHDEGLGPVEEGSKILVNIQPVIPVPINDDWNLISRTIVPIVRQEDVSQEPGTQSGLGDVLQSLFFSPESSDVERMDSGVGPVLLVPTASDDRLGTDKWGTGPTAVVLKQTASGWTYGALANSFSLDQVLEKLTAASTSGV